jgi:hypothetical protein
MSKQRGLSRAVGADQSDTVAGAELQRHVAQGLDRNAMAGIAGELAA